MEKYQFSKVKNELQFEQFTRDLLNLIYRDNSFQLYGRNGQKQYGLDGFSTIHPIFFQCKHKSSPYIKDRKLIEELEDEFNKAKSKIEELSNSTKSRFLFFTTHPNTTKLQDKAKVLSTNNIIVEYWGWDTIESYLNNLYLPKNREFFIKYYPEYSNGLNDSNKVSKWDKNLYNKFSNETSSGISFIYTFNFYYKFQLYELNELNDFCGKWNNAEHEFLNEELERKKLAFYRKLNVFLNELSHKSFPTDDKGDGGQSIIQKDNLGNILAFSLQNVEKINNLSREVYKLHQEFIRLGKEYIYG